MSDQMRDELACTVVSLVPFELRENKPGLVPANYIIPACRNQEIPVCKIIKRAHFFVYLDEDRGSIQQRELPDVVAAAICRDYIDSQLAIAEDCMPALFWLFGALGPMEVREKHKERLAKARADQNNWLVALCRMADNDWNQYHKHNVVSAFQREAAEMIGWKPEEHEWMNGASVLNSTRCPACQQLYSEGTVICSSCGCILDKEKYKTLEFAGKK